jgi:hypothetical protein
MSRRNRPKSEGMREAALLLHLDPDKLTEGDRLRCQLVSTLRGAIDHEQAKSETGSSADLAKLVAAVEALTKLLPANVTAPPESKYIGDPAARLAQIILGAVRRAPQSGPVEASPVAPPVDEAAPTQPPPADTPPPTADNVTPLHKPNAAKPDAAPQPKPATPLADLLASTPADQAGGSAGFHINGAPEPWREHVGSSLDAFCWNGAKGRSW